MNALIFKKKLSEDFTLFLFFYRLGEPNFLKSLKSMSDLHTLLNLVNRPAKLSTNLLAGAVGSMNTANDRKLVFQEYIDHFTKNWRSLCAWEAMSNIDVPCEPIFEKAQETLQTAVQMIDQALNNVQSYTNDQNPQKMLELALFNDESAIKNMELAISRGRTQYILYSLHRAFGQALLDLLSSVLDGESTISVCGYLETVKTSVNDKCITRILDMWQNLISPIENLQNVRSIQQSHLRAEQFRIVQELAGVILKRAISHIKVRQHKSVSKRDSVSSISRSCMLSCFD